MMRTLYVLLLLLFPALSGASIDGIAGPYRLSFTTTPRTIPVGRATLETVIKDSSGKPANGLTVGVLVRMPGMFMGEREQLANELPGKPGSYSVPAAFPMGGAYEVVFKLKGPLGEGAVTLQTHTGQDTVSSGGGPFSIASLIPWLIGLSVVAFVGYRIRKSGQRVGVKGAFSRGAIGGVLLLVAMLATATYAVRNWRRDGAMTPIEAQVMEMNMPPPPGTTPVELGEVRRRSIAETVRYSGQAIGFVEQEVNARVTGVIVAVPFYVGDKVRKGQVLARLDTTQLDPQLAERAAMTDSAARNVGVAAADYRTALQDIAQARAEVTVKESAVAEAEALLEGAKQDKDAANAEVVAVQGDVANAQAEVTAAEQTAAYRTAELTRMQELLKGGFVSRSAVQQSESEAAAANAKLIQARSMVRQSESRAAGAKANARKAEAMINAVQKRVRQAIDEVSAAKAAVTSRQRAADAAKQVIARERAGVDQARAGYERAAVERGYATIVAESDGVVTERSISPGTLVGPGQTILKVAQVAPIRLQANVAAGDLGRIKVGSPAELVGIGEGRVSSVAPSADPQSRTAVVEVIWPNTDRRVMPGQFVEMRIALGAASSQLTVPVEAVQRPPGGASPFVWIAEASSERGRFTVRRVPVELGITDGKRYAVTGVLKEGDQVVTLGASSLKEGGLVFAAPQELASKGPTIEITAEGYKPESITVEVGKPVTITFIRRTDQSCGTEITFPELKITKPLPLNIPVEVTFTPQRAGNINFTCGMDMLHGKVVVR